MPPSTAAGGEVLGRLLNFLNRLEEAHLRCPIGHTRPGSVMVDISLPGWRWKVEFIINGSVEIERTSQSRT
jgi:hypothetical protein